MNAHALLAAVLTLALAGSLSAADRSAASSAERSDAGQGTSQGQTGQGRTGQSGQMGQSGQTGQSGQSTSTPEAQVAADLTAANDSEIAAAKLAATKAQSAPVKEFARMMQKEHEAANKKLSMLMKSQGLSTQNDEMSRRRREDTERTTKKLSEVAGQDFDRSYVEQQVQAHQDVMKLIDDSMDKVKGKQLSAFLKEQRKSVQKHLQHAQRLQNQPATKSGK